MPAISPNNLSLLSDYLGLRYTPTQARVSPIKENYIIAWSDGEYNYNVEVDDTILVEELMRKY